MTLLVLLALASALFVLLGGYLLGARAGRGAREALRADLAVAEAERAASESARAAAESRVSQASNHSVQASIHAAKVAAAVGERDREILVQEMEGGHRERDALRAQLDGLKGEMARMATQLRASTSAVEVRKELHQMLAPLLAREADNARLREELSTLLKPMVERERLGVELTRVNAVASRGELPGLLTAMAHKGGFGGILLSDQAGLPMAASADLGDIDALAAAAGMYLTVGDRLVLAGRPRPTVLALRDDANGVALNRIFRVGDERYVLTALGRGAFLPHDVLDPALVRIEQLIGRKTLQGP